MPGFRKNFNKSFIRVLEVINDSSNISYLVMYKNITLNRSFVNDFFYLAWRAHRAFLRTAFLVMRPNQSSGEGRRPTWRSQDLALIEVPRLPRCARKDIFGIAPVGPTSAATLPPMTSVKSILGDPRVLVTLRLSTFRLSTIYRHYITRHLLLCYWSLLIPFSVLT